MGKSPSTSDRFSPHPRRTTPRSVVGRILKLKLKKRFQEREKQLEAAPVKWLRTPYQVRAAGIQPYSTPPFFFFINSNTFGSLASLETVLSF